MYESVETIRETRKRYNGKLFSSGVKTFKKFEEVEAESLADGALARKYKELIALGISLTENCLGCVEYHVTAALEAGATEAEIAETAAVAVCIGGGRVTWPARFIFKVLDELKSKNA
jgi:AhpD family alkylhydroperoxidase